MYVIERDKQPGAFGTLPPALWWAVVTLTTTGYGDEVPLTHIGPSARRRCHDLRHRHVRLCRPASWPPVLPPKPAGAISSRPGTSSARCRSSNRSTRRRSPKSRICCGGSKCPSGPPSSAAAKSATACISSPAAKCRSISSRRRFASARAPFFGELALLGDSVRTANVTTTMPSTLLILDLADFRTLTANHPDLKHAIDAEGQRRMSENQQPRERHRLGASPDAPSWDLTSCNL